MRVGFLQPFQAGAWTSDGEGLRMDTNFLLGFPPIAFVCKLEDSVFKCSLTCPFSPDGPQPKHGFARCTICRIP